MNFMMGNKSLFVAQLNLSRVRLQRCYLFKYLGMYSRNNTDQRFGYFTEQPTDQNAKALDCWSSFIAPLLCCQLFAQ